MMQDKKGNIATGIVNYKDNNKGAYNDSYKWKGSWEHWETVEGS